MLGPMSVFCFRLQCASPTARTTQPADAPTKQGIEEVNRGPARNATGDAEAMKPAPTSLLTSSRDHHLVEMSDA